MTKEEREKFAEDLLHKRQNRSHTVRMRHYIGDQANDIESLLEILSLDQSNLTDEGRKLLDYLESTPKENQTPTINYEQFKWKLLAFISIQDTFNTTIYDDDYHLMLQQHYFYYESKYNLTECIIAGLNGLHLASKQLLRNVIEFNLLQLHFSNECKRVQSYKPFKDYLDNHIQPATTKLIYNALPNDNFCKPIKKRIQLELKNLSNQYSHAYEPGDSPKNSGVYSPGNVLESIYFWLHTSLVLDMVLWMYFVKYPMLFHPVDVVKKFGFNGPVGLFCSFSTNSIIKKALSSYDYEIFKKYAGEQEEIKDLLEYYNNSPDLTEEQIWATLTDEREPNDTYDTCYTKAMAKMRAMFEVIGVDVRKHDAKIEDFDEKIILQGIGSFSEWNKIYKKI